MMSKWPILIAQDAGVAIRCLLMRIIGNAPSAMRSGSIWKPMEARVSEGYSEDVSMNDQRSIDLYQRDARFRAQVLSAVARAMDEGRGRVGNDEIRWQDVHDIALNAAVTALRNAFDGDAELTAARIERDRYKELALKGLELTPPRMIIPADAIASGEHEVKK